MSLCVKNVLLGNVDLTTNIAEQLDLELRIKETNKESKTITLKGATQETILNLLTVFDKNGLRNLVSMPIRLIEFQYTNKTRTIAIGNILNDRWLDVDSGKIVTSEEIKGECNIDVIAAVFD